MMFSEQIQILFDEYLETLDDEQEDEYFYSDKEKAKRELNGFMEWLKEKERLSYGLNDPR